MSSSDDHNGSLERQWSLLAASFNSGQLLEELQVGDRHYGVVRELAEFGAYVDLGG
jgi:ribosomal protein S1